MKTKGDKKKVGKSVEEAGDGGEESDDVYIVDNDEEEHVDNPQPDHDAHMLEAMLGRGVAPDWNYSSYQQETVTCSNTGGVIDLTDAVDDTADIVIVDEEVKPAQSAYGGNKRMSAFQVHQALRATETQDESCRKRRKKRKKRSMSRTSSKDDLDDSDEDNQQSKSEYSQKKKKISETKYIDEYFVCDSDSKHAVAHNFEDEGNGMEEGHSWRKVGQAKVERNENGVSCIDEVTMHSTAEMVDLSGSPASQEDDSSKQKPESENCIDLVDTSSKSGGINAVLSAMAGYSNTSDVQDKHFGKSGRRLRDSPLGEAESDRQTPSTEELIVVQSKIPKAITTSTGVIVMMQHPAEFAVKGRVTVQPLAGSVTIMGHCLQPNGTKHNIYSPSSNSLLTINTKHSESNIDKAFQAVLDHDSSVGSSEEFIREHLQKFKDFVVVKFEKLSSVTLDFVTSFTPNQRLFEATSGSKLNELTALVGVSLHSDYSWPSVTISHELRRVLETWSDSLLDKNTVSPAIMVCGGKDSGKSTTNRLLMNVSLNRVEEVYYLECDVGQTEFTPPGCVSLHRVTEPIFGPPFCHQRQPIISYHFGGLSPADDPDLYLECVRKCHRYFRQLATKGPLVVNTMGWLKGLGLQLLIDTIYLVCPSHLVQLMSRTAHQNAPPISEEFLQQQSWSDLTANKTLHVSEGQLRTLEREYKLFIVDTPLTGPQTMASRLRPNDHRNLSLLSHLGSDLEPGLTLFSTLPYTVPFHSVAIHVCHSGVPWSQVLGSINAAVVALCKADLSRAEQISDDMPLHFQKVPVCQWLGYGIVRGIDREQKLLYIVTPLPYKILQDVNTLVKGSVTLPDQLLKTQPCEELPAYVDDTVQSMGSGAVKPRRHMPRRGLR